MNAAARRSPRSAGLPALDPDARLDARAAQVEQLEALARTAEASARKARQAARAARQAYEDERTLADHYGGLPLEGLTP